jgi:Zn-dependent M28 family amino/carboxypeptidase
MLACAKLLSGNAPRRAVCFAAFNREEEGLIGSTDFTASYLRETGIAVSGAHILEMVGYGTEAPGSQRLPAGLPIRIPDRGNFLGLIGDGASGDLMDAVLRKGKGSLPDFPVIGLKLDPGEEAGFSVLLRSDHVPFWKAGVPALMWTDTAEFRNPHYHQTTDAPDTLDYGFLLNVTKVLGASLLG